MSTAAGHPPPKTIPNERTTERAWNYVAVGTGHPDGSAFWTDAPTMLDLHARHHARGIGERAAPILWVVEQAAPTHQDIARVWAQNSDYRRTGSRWAAATLLTKPGAPPHLSQRYAEEVFWIAIDPGTYRSLTLGRGYSPSGFETWIRNFYGKMLLH